MIARKSRIKSKASGASGASESKRSTENVEHTEEISVRSNLQKFHGWVKEQLYYMCFNKMPNTDPNKDINLFEIGVGVANDMWRWEKVGINNVLGIDSNHSQIDEAIRRISEVLIPAKKRDLKEKNRFLQYNMYTVDMANENVLNALDTIISKNEYNAPFVDRKFELVSCQFAFHYFFSSEEVLDRVIRNISELLIEGGLFFGTAVDGDEVIKVLNGNTSFSTDSAGGVGLELKVREPITQRNIGQKLSYKITTPYFQGLDEGESKEFFLFKDKLIEVCNRYGLEVCFDFYIPSLENTDISTEYSDLMDQYGCVSFKNWYNLYYREKTAGYSKFMNFMRNTNLSNSELSISSLNFSFIFKKKINIPTTDILKKSLYQTFNVTAEEYNAISKNYKQTFIVQDEDYTEVLQNHKLIKVINREQDSPPLLLYMTFVFKYISLRDLFRCEKIQRIYPGITSISEAERIAYSADAGLTILRFTQFTNELYRSVKSTASVRTLNPYSDTTTMTPTTNEVSMQIARGVSIPISTEEQPLPRYSRHAKTIRISGR